MSGLGADQPPVPAEPHASSSDSTGAEHTNVGDKVTHKIIRGDVCHAASHHIPSEISVSQQTIIPRCSAHSPPSTQRADDSPSNAGIIKATPEPDTHSHIGKATCMAAVPEITSIRATILAARLDCKRERARCRQQEKDFQTLLGTLRSEFKAAKVDGFSLSAIERLEQMSERLEASVDVLDRLQQKSSEVEDYLSSQEYELMKLEEEVYHSLDAKLRLDCVATALSDDQPSVSSSQQAAADDTVIQQSPLEELYSRMSDLRIFLDRLTNFEYGLREELDHRDVLRTRGLLDSSTDAAFLEEARVEREMIQKDLQDAQADVARLKELCIRQGIEFEDVQFHNPFPNAETDSFSTPSTREEAAHLPLPEIPLGVKGSLFIAKERVRRWLTDLTSPQGQGNGAAEHEIDTETRRDSWSDAGWVMAHNRPRRQRPSAYSEGDGAHIGMPVWTSGPPPGSSHLEALLRESTAEISTAGPIRHIIRRASHKSL